MINRLKQILAVQTVTFYTKLMNEYIVEICKSKGYSYKVHKGNIYIIKGGGKSSYPCIIAHTDTVHDMAENLTVIEDAGELFGYNRETKNLTGIGGDDKVGIFIALEILNSLDSGKVAFFKDEEIGCHGSNLADVKFFKDCNFILQFDRKGNTDFVTNAAGEQLSNKLFQDAVKPYLIKYNYNFCPNGGLTDVAELKSKGIEVSMANISCGYYNPHSDNEYIIIADVINAYNLGLDICTNLTAKYKHSREAYKPTYYGYKNKVADKLDSGNWFNSRQPTDKISHKYCDICGVKSETLQKTYGMMCCDWCTSVK